METGAQKARKRPRWQDTQTPRGTHPQGRHECSGGTAAPREAVTVIAGKDKRQVFVAAQPKAKDAENALKPEWQAEEGVMRRVRGQGKPPVILDMAGPLTRAGAQTDIASIPALLGLGDTQRHHNPDIDGRHVVTTIRQVVPKSKQRGPNTPSPVPDSTTQSIVPV